MLGKDRRRCPRSLPIRDPLCSACEQATEDQQVHHCLNKAYPSACAVNDFAALSDFFAFISVPLLLFSALVVLRVHTHQPLAGRSTLPTRAWDICVIGLSQ